MLVSSVCVGPVRKPHCCSCHDGDYLFASTFRLELNRESLSWIHYIIPCSDDLNIDYFISTFMYIYITCKCLFILKCFIEYLFQFFFIFKMSDDSVLRTFSNCLALDEIFWHPDCSVCSVVGFWLAIYLCSAGLNPTADASEIIIEKPITPGISLPNIKNCPSFPPPPDSQHLD